MSEILPPSSGIAPQPSMVAPVVAPAETQHPVVLKRGVKDFLEFLETSKEVFFAYVYHRTGSRELTKTLVSEIYLDVLVRALSLWWFGTLSIKLLCDAADAALKDRTVSSTDLETTYLPSLVWLTDAQRQSVATLHEALWTLPAADQRLLILSLLIGLSNERIAQTMRMRPDDVTKALDAAKAALLARWQPTSDVVTKLQSLVFVPALDAASDASLRFSVMEKYNALRFRRYQWVMIGGLFAVMSNVIVASVLAFAVITEPPTSLRGTRSQVASLDAVLLKRQIAIDNAKGSLATSFKEAQRLAAYDVSRDLTALGLASALESLKAQQDQEADVDRLIKLMQQAKTAMAPILDPVVRLAWNDAVAMVAWL